MRTTIFLFVMTLLSSCGKSSDGTSVWAGGLWIIPMLPFIGALITGYLTYKQSSGGAVKVIDGRVTDEPAKKLKFYEAPYFWMFVMCVLGFIGIIIWVNAER